MLASRVGLMSVTPLSSDPYQIWWHITRTTAPLPPNQLVIILLGRLVLINVKAVRNSVNFKAISIVSC